MPVTAGAGSDALDDGRDRNSKAGPLVSADAAASTVDTDAGSAISALWVSCPLPLSLLCSERTF
jgi:hypothetical protein